MRLYNLFEETPTVYNEEDLRDFFEQVFTKCSDIVKLYRQYPGSYFYRGSYNRTGFIWHEVSRSDRKPSNTTPELQAAVDMLMRGQGLTAVRSNSIFVTSDLNIATKYTMSSSSAYVIFPVNGFNYSWAPLIRDFYVRGFRSTPQDRITLGGSLAPTADELLDAALHQEYEWFKHTYRYTNTNLDKALGSGKEVLINGAYYGFPISGDDPTANVNAIDLLNGILHR